MLDLLIAWVVFPAVQLVLWFGCGSLVARLTDIAIPRSLLAPLGFCLVIVVGGFLTAVPELAELTTPVVAGLAVAGLALRRPWRGSRPSPWLVGGLVIVWAVYAAPIVLSGSATFAGYITLDDTATWLALTDRVMEAGRDLEGLARSSYEATLAFNLADGYPIGVFVPLGVGRAFVALDTAWLVQPYMALLAILLALSLWALSGSLIRSARARALVVVLAVQPALLFGYYLWGGIKELAAAGVIALVAGLAPQTARAEAGLRTLVALALAIAALIGCLSLAGSVWVGPLLFGMLIIAARGSSLVGMARRSVGLLALVGFLIAPVLLGDSLLPPTSSPLDDPDAKGNLIGPLSPFQALGVWPAGDFRVDPGLVPVTAIACLVVLAAALVACAVAIRGQRWEIAGYIVGAPLAAIAIAAVGSPWVQGKAFATVSPALLFAALLGCAWAWGERRLAIGAVAASVIAMGVVWSNAIAYHEVNLGPRDQLEELETIGQMIEGEGPALMTEYQPYGVRHFLREADAEGASELRRRLVPLLDGSSLEKGLWADTDDFDPDSFDPYQSLVLRRSPEQSRPPGPFSLAWAGEFYELWTREPAVAEPAMRLPLGIGSIPVAEPECGDVRRLARAVPHGTLVAAESLKPLFVGPKDMRSPREWPTVDGFPVPSGEGEIRVDVAVEGGQYSVWLGGSIRGRAGLVIDGIELSSRRNILNNDGLYTELGVIELEPGRHRVAVRFSGGDISPGSGGSGDPVGPIAFGPPPDATSTLSEAGAGDAEELCGRSWDWIEALP
ncbi:MAG: hypothetical protein M3355_05425 [Actinomycetota bacterium]|nr:hypothetical protein [Actinomycetota bacterium]